MEDLRTTEPTPAEDAAEGVHKALAQFQEQVQEALQESMVSAARFQHELMRLFLEAQEQFAAMWRMSQEEDPKLRLGRQLLEEWEAEHGKISEEELADVRARWHA